jgi:hypothetical protein
MKKRFSLALLLCLLFGSSLFSQDPTKKLEVLYFHATRRCATCLAIEENTRKALDTYFADQVKNGTIKLTIINVDEDKNKAIAEKYEASGSALFLTTTDKGKETKNDMTDFAFSYARSNPTKFIGGLKDKITELLK